MLQVLNSRERNEAFLKFLLFFIITVALVVCAVFFDFKLSTKEITSLREKLDAQYRQETYEKKFLSTMAEAMNKVTLVDSSLDKDNIGMATTYNDQLSSKVNIELPQQEDGITGLYKTMNTQIVTLFTRIHSKNIDLTSAKTDRKNFENQLKACNDEKNAQSNQPIKIGSN